MKQSLDPKKVVLRESCDSDVNPNSMPIIVAVDVTGSMGMIAEVMARKGLGKLIEGILDDKPVEDPHIMFMAIGDTYTDSAPLQVSQFEADIRIAQQLTDIWLEGCGGGNDTEGYDLPWYFAATKTKIDSFDKRGKKGYLFTIGDEMPPKGASKKDLDRIFGSGAEKSWSSPEMLAAAQQKYHVFHVIVEQGSYASRNLGKVRGAWKEVLGSRALSLNDYELLPQVILSALSISEGKDPKEVLAALEDKHVRATVKHALDIE
jgi:hypothetical protein